MRTHRGYAGTARLVNAIPFNTAVNFILVSLCVVFYHFFLRLFIDLEVRIVLDVISLPGIVVGLLVSLIAHHLIHDPSPLGASLGSSSVVNFSWPWLGLMKRLQMSRAWVAAMRNYLL